VTSIACRLPRDANRAALADASIPPACWVITDGKPGMENQCLGLAEAMGITPDIKRLRLPRAWRELSLHLGWGGGPALVRAEIVPPWPDLLIASGRTSVLASLHVKQASGGRTFTVQIQRPVVGINRFDRVIAPAHDALRGDNVISMTGALYRASPQLLQQEAAKWSAQFAYLPRPYVAVMIGGPNLAISPLRRLSSYRLGPGAVTEIANQLRTLARTAGAGLLITASRRTGAANVARLRTILRDCAAWIWHGEGENPYYGILGLADNFIVTSDSVNMICEACSTGKPVQIIQLSGHSRKFKMFHDSLAAAGCVRDFDGSLEHWHYEPLREKQRVAMLVRQAYEQSSMRVTGCV